MAVKYESLIIKKCLCKSWYVDSYTPSNATVVPIISYFWGLYPLTFDAKGIKPDGKPIFFITFFC